ncbi:hypothetical protein [Herbaspirillum rhizosphaerae]|uniref:hypothetical protein n=1 Tax=Herbaspirillum rhizosphaerae TaxID=346179 RepID=UPI00067CF08E|nr:hypothetical protein [Herbaspirillum rhizosphaerae]
MSIEISSAGRVKMKHPRVEYFAGQFLEDKDFEIEQKYHLMRRRQLNQELFSHGVRRGFALMLEGAGGKAVRIHVGAAMDVRGHEIWLDEDIVWNLPMQTDGEYFLCMQALEVEDEKETYSVPTQASGESGSNDGSPWIGYTRRVDTIQFSLMKVRPQLPAPLITLAKIQCSKGGFSNMDTLVRDISLTKVGNGVSINLVEPGHYIDMQYKGTPNAYIGPNLDRQTPDCVTFSSRSKRMHLSGEEDLYILNKKGMVVSTAWGAGGSLTVQGKTYLEAGLDVKQAVDIQGSLKVKDEIRFAGAELKTRDGNSGVIFDSHANDLYLHGQKTLYISNRNGVVIEKDDAGGGLGKAGSLHVKGVLKVDKEVSLNESLNVTQKLTAGSLAVTGVADVTQKLTAGSLAVTGVANVTQKLTAGSLAVTGVADVTQKLTAGSLAVTGVANVTQKLTAGSLAVTGVADVTQKLTAGSLAVTGVADVTQKLTAGSLAVTGVADVTQKLTAGSLAVTGVADVTQKLTAGSLAVTGVADVTQKLTAGSLAVTGVADVTQKLTAGSLAVTGVANVTQKLTAGSLAVTGVADVIQKLTAGSLAVTGVADVTQKLTAGSLAVTGVADVTQKLTAGSLAVTGVADVTQKLTAGSLEVTGITTMRGALTVTKELIVPGAKFTSHGGSMKLEGAEIPDSEEKARQPLHIFGDMLFLLQKKKVVIGKEWESSGNLEVHGKSALNTLDVAGESKFKGLVVHSAGTFSNQKANSDTIKEKLQGRGNFFFFVEPGSKNGDSEGEGNLIVYWKTSRDEIRACKLTDNPSVRKWI